MNPLRHLLQTMTHGDVYSVWDHVQMSAPTRAHNRDSCGASYPSLPLASCFQLHAKRYRVNAPLHLFSYPESPIHLWCCAVLSARRRCYCVACSCVAMRSYSRITFESLHICTPALLNDIGRELSVKKKVSLPEDQSTFSRAFLWSKKWMWRRFSLSSEG